MKTINVATAKTAELVAFFNAHAEKPVTKFASRAVAEKRVAVLIAAIESADTKAEETGNDVYGFESHGLTLCPHCGIHLSNGVGVHDDDVNGKKVKHAEFVFSCLGCGGEFGDPIPGAKVVDEKRSAAVAASWSKPEVKAARSARHAVEVDGVAYRSVREAFKALGLPDAKHIKFRGELKKAGEGVFEGHDFKLVQE